MCVSSRTPNPPGARKFVNATGIRKESLLGILCVDAAFDRVTADDDVILSQGQWIAGGDFELELDQVDARDHLRHRVLHLDARVHLDEVVLTFNIVEHELHRAGIAVTDLLAQRDGGLGETFPQLVIEDGRRRLLDQLLIASLRRAVPLTQMHRGLPIGHDLDLDVPDIGEVPLDVHGRVPEGRLGL